MSGTDDVTDAAGPSEDLKQDGVVGVSDEPP
jgi:hypothetical protein